MRSNAFVLVWAFFTLSLATPSFSQATSPDKVPDLLSSSDGKTGVFEVLPPPGHHLNEKAPATASEGTTSLHFEITRAKMDITLPASAAEQEIAVEAFVCDDANTFCRKKSQTFHVAAVTATPRSKNAAADAPVSHAATAKAEKPHFEKETGFFVNDPKRAFALAVKKKLPLMIDFYGIWCPPCNHLDAMVFRSAEFKAKTGKQFVHLKLDSDQDSFNDLKNRYKIQFLPTVVFATASGDEIFRLVGFHPLDEMLTKSEAAYASREVGFAQLESEATGGNAEARYKAARIALDRDEPAKALEWLAPLKGMLAAAHDPRLADFYRAQLGTAQAASDKKLAQETLEQWTKAFPDSPDGLENYQTLADLQEAAGQTDASHASIAAAIALSDRLLAAPTNTLSESYYTPADVAESRADLIEKAGDKTRIREAYLACAEAYKKEAVAEGTAFPRGPNLERAYCLGKAGEVAASEALYHEGIRRFPGEYTFYQGLAKLWLDSAKDGAKALPEAKKAVHFAYGNQRLKAMMTLARAYESVQEPAKAIDAIEAELSVPAPAGAGPGTLKLRERLRAMAEELHKKAAPVKTS